ncbi:MAG TPA: ATP-grasp domain-containing protein, partial [Thermomicrobiales bacterium]|nr:ATP-grasp domain-containing protein [Thermomicrobiales bacterium]
MILPGATVGVLGGGQLGRMFTLQANAMGYRVVVLDPDPNSPAGAVAYHHLRAPYDDEQALAELARRCAAVTTEFENVPAAALARLASTSIVRPPIEAVATAQDRIAEKSYFQQCGLATAAFRPVNTRHDLAAAVAVVPFPAILKTSRFGYDGKGQAVVHNEREAAAAFERFNRAPCILEERVRLERELSVILARGTDGGIATFPVAENRHEKGILETSLVPARISDQLAAEARNVASAIAEGMKYVGVLGVELFVVQ